METTTERYYTLSEAADALNLSRPTLMKMIEAGDFVGATQGDKKRAAHQIPHSAIKAVRALILIDLQDKIRDMMEREIQYG